MGLVSQQLSTTVGGRLSYFKENWQELTEDPWILETVVGNRIDFLAMPTQANPLVLDSGKSAIMSKEIYRGVDSQQCGSQGFRRCGRLHKFRS